MPQSRPAVVLLSGGIDSTTTLAIAQSEGFTPYALTIRYGQRHAVEIVAAERVARCLGAAEHVVLDLDLRTFGGSALTSDVPVPKTVPASPSGGSIPITYVPARNTIFLSLALAWAEVLGSEHIFLGVNALDYSGYPDCRPGYIEAFQRLARVATRAAVEGTQRLEIHTPLISLTKRQIIQRGLELGLDYGMTVSCYDPSDTGQPCGGCESCRLRARGCADLGMPPPASAAPPHPPARR